jgi:hypothetical protein
VAVFTAVSVQAQEKVELKLNPIGALFGSPDLSGEYFINEKFGAELTLSVEMGKYNVGSSDSFNPKKSGFGLMVAGKYYFKDDAENDGFYAGLYARTKSFKVDDKNEDDYIAFKRNITAGGILIGQKWASDNGMVYELKLGVGRTFSESNEWIDEQGTLDDDDLELGIDILGGFSIGYRF